MPKVTLLDRHQSFEIPTDSVMYDALCDVGVELPHGCLSGSCGACRIEVVEGASNLFPLGVIEKDTVACVITEHEKLHGAGTLAGKTVRLSCRAKVLGDVSILPLGNKK